MVDVESYKKDVSLPFDVEYFLYARRTRLCAMPGKLSAVFREAKTTTGRTQYRLATDDSVEIGTSMNDSYCIRSVTRRLRLLRAPLPGHHYQGTITRAPTRQLAYLNSNL